MFQMSAHVSCCKYPEPDKLPGLWRENLEPMMQFMLRASQGMR